jgi:hypothetical protein
MSTLQLDTPTALVPNFRHRASARAATQSSHNTVNDGLANVCVKTGKRQRIVAALYVADLTPTFQGYLLQNRLSVTCHRCPRVGNPQACYRLPQYKRA